MSTFRATATKLAEELLSQLTTESRSFTSTSQAYDPAFIEKCASIADDKRTLIEIRNILRTNIKNFSLRDFNSLLSDAKLAFFKAANPSSSTKNTPFKWQNLLIRASNGSPKPLLANAITALRHSPDWLNVLAFDEFANRPVKRLTPPFPSPLGDWSNNDDILAANWFQHASIEIGKNTSADAIQAVSHDHTFHPIRDYLNSLKWDGEPRLSRWLTSYLGVEWSELKSQQGSKFLISAVARIMTPGCKVDTCLILEGAQGRLKSTALAALFHRQWFSDQISADLAGKDSSQDLPGKWCFEFAEFDKLSKYDQGVIKSFIPRQTDHYRPSYGIRTEDIPRQNVFTGSVNKEAYLQDETGGRRWWCVKVGDLDIPSLIRDRDQLWAEALSIYLDGTTAPFSPLSPRPGLWWLIDENIISDAKSEAAARYETDPWDAAIIRWIEDDEAKWNKEEKLNASKWQRPFEPYFIQTDVIMELCLKKPIGSWTTSEKARVGKILTFHGFERFQRRMTTVDGVPVLNPKGEQRREWYYRRPPSKT